MEASLGSGFRAGARRAVRRRAGGTTVRIPCLALLAALTLSAAPAAAQNTPTVTIAGGAAITVTDVDEPPSAPTAVNVTAGADDPEESLDVTWTAPLNTGPPITNYDVPYQLSTTNGWVKLNVAAPDGPTRPFRRITGLSVGETYVVEQPQRRDGT